MRKDLLATAVALACLGLTPTAQAYKPTNNDDADYALYFAGATASNLTLRQTFIEQVCDAAAGDIDEFNVNSPTNPLHWAVACTTTTAKVPGLAISPARVILYKTNEGGSGTGVNPVEQRIARSFLRMDTCTKQSDQTTPAPLSVPFERYACSNSSFLSQVPDGGTSDIEPDKFFGINRTAGSEDFKGLGNLTVFSVAHLVYGVPVTLKLRNQLQRAQFPTTSLCHPSNAGYTLKLDGSAAASAREQAGESEQCMPSLSKQHVRSIMGGQIANWNQLAFDDPNTPAVDYKPLTDAAYGGAPVANAGGTADSLVQICRRVEGSGTQAQFNAIFMDWPCDVNRDGSIDQLLPATTSNPLGGPKVALNSGSGNVRQCLNDYDDGDANEMTNPTKPATDATRIRWAVGVQSLENNVSLADRYRFIKVDGYAPTLEQVHAGNYDDWAAQSIQWRTDATTYVWGAPPLGSAAKGAEVAKIFTAIKDRWVTPSSIVALNNDYVHSFGQSGWLLEPSNTTKPNNVLVLSNPVNAYTRSPAGKPNTCQEPVRANFNTESSKQILIRQ